MRASPAAALSLIVLLATAVAATPATAGQTVLTSRSPYWKVGERDDALSRACALNRFNMEEPERLVARFVGKDGPEVLGIAKGSGLNLRDPDHRAKPTEDYFFRNHGTTACEVYVGGRRKGAQKK